MRKHYVTFLSPGTFFNEETSKEIESWDTKIAVAMSKTIIERHSALPYGFYFVTKLSAPPIPDGEGGILEILEKEVKQSGIYYLGGTLLKLDDVLNDEKYSILRSNMIANRIPIAIQNDNSWKFTGFFRENDSVVDEFGNITIAGNNPKLMEYRNKKLKEIET